MNKFQGLSVNDLRNTNGGWSPYEFIVEKFAETCAEFTVQVIKDVQTGMQANAEKARQKEIAADIARRKLLH